MLIDLAKEPSSEKRRELLLRVTDAFLARPADRTEQEAAIFDDIVEAVASDLETQVRVELARKIAATSAPVRRTARRLAMDVIAVARPIVERSRALEDSDLLEVIEQRGADHHVAVTKRDDLSSVISDALVNTGSDRVLHSLLENRTARIDRQTFEKVTERARANPILHAPLVRNNMAPLDLLNAIYLEVAAQLRREILKRFSGVSPDELEAALVISRSRLSAAYGAIPPDFDVATAHVAAIEKRGAMRPQMLVEMLREGQRTAFLITLAKLVDLEFGLVQRLIDSGDLDALAMFCRCVGFDRALFVTLCLMIGGQQYGMTKAEAFGQLYEQVPVAAAQRAVRFWKLRRKESQRATIG